jgi:hypothetical protein
MARSHTSWLTVATIAALVVLVLLVVSAASMKYYGRSVLDHFQRSAGPGSSCELSKFSAQTKARTLWGAHGDLTRTFALRYLNNLPGQHEALDALAGNQNDIAHFLDSVTPGIRQEAAAALKKHSITDLISVLDSIKTGSADPNVVANWHQSGVDVANVHAKALGVNAQQLATMLTNHDAESVQIWLLHEMGQHQQEAPRVQKNLDRLRTMADYMVSNVQCGLENKDYEGGA